MHRILLPSDRIARLRNARRYPNQAALLARLPVAGRRVPLRPYWRRRHVDPLALARESVKVLPTSVVYKRSRHPPNQRRRIGEASRRWGAAPGATAHRGRIAAAAVPPIAKTGGPPSRVPPSRSRAQCAGAAPPKRPARARARMKRRRCRPKALHRAPPEPRHTGMVTALALALGASLMYLLDPTSGRRRRG